MNNYNLKSVLFQLNQWCVANNISVKSVYDSCHGLTLQELVYYLLGVVKDCVESVVNLNDKFEELYNFVHDYFENLDVQKEINIKLDQMVEDGTIDLIFNRFVIKRVIVDENELNAVYVSVNGDDNTGDGTQEKPVATIGKAIQIGGTWYTDIRVFIISPGTYDIGWATMSANLHLTATVDGVILNAIGNIRNYASHSTIQSTPSGKMTINLNNFAWYFDGHTLFSNCNINGLIQCSDAGLRFNNCNITNVSCYSAYCYIYGTTTFNDLNNISRTCLYMINSMLYLDGNISVNVNTEVEKSNFIYAVGTKINITTLPNTIGTGKYNTAYIHWCSNAFSLNVIQRLCEICDNVDIEYNVNVPYTRAVYQTFNATNVNSASSKYVSFFDERNYLIFDAGITFNSESSGQTSYQYYELNGNQVFYITSTSGNILNLEKDETLYILGFGMISYKDTTNTEHSKMVPIVAYTKNNITTVGVVSNRSEFNSLLYLAFNLNTIINEY